MTAPERFDWVWYGVDENGESHVSLGRWQKHPCQFRYKFAEVQPTEHDHTRADLIPAAALAVPVVVASEKRRQAAQVLWDVLQMTNGAHDGMSRDEVEALWDAVKEQSGFGAVTAFLDALRGEVRE